jgi:hypothetical protein
MNTQDKIDRLRSIRYSIELLVSNLDDFDIDAEGLTIADIEQAIDQAQAELEAAE